MGVVRNNSHSSRRCTYEAFFFCGEETKEVPEKWCCFGQFLFLSLKQNYTYRFEVSSVDKIVC